MSFARCLALMFIFGLVVSPVAIAAGEDSLAESADNAPADNASSAARIDELIGQLDADRYSQREAAVEELTAIGKPAIAALTEAATAGSLEVTIRSLDILKELHESSDETTKTAVKDALKRLADGDHPQASRRADAIVNPKKDTGQAANIRGGVILGGAVFGGRGGGRRMSVRTQNGVKTIEVQENDKNTKIIDDPKQGITVEVTTKKNGREATKKVTAKDTEDLKKKDKEAYDLYLKFSGRGGAQVRKGVARVVQPRQQEIDMATKILKAWSQRIPDWTDENDLKAAPKKSIEELQKEVDGWKQIITDLEKRIQAQADGVDKEADDKANEKAEE